MISKSLLKEVLLSNEEQILGIAPTLMHRSVGGVMDLPRKTTVFYGVRRSGKTFLLYQRFLANRETALYLDFEDDRLHGFTLQDFQSLQESFLELKPHLDGKPLVLLLDEVQNVDGWEKFCRRAVEREGHQVMVSGSSSKIMPFEIATELRGRAQSIEVLPFSFKEFLRTKGIDSAKPTILYGSRKSTLKRHCEEYLRWGGFPEVIFANNDLSRSKLVREYLTAMFFRDLVERYSISNIPLLDALSEKLLSSFSTKVSLGAVAKQFKNLFPFSKDSLYQLYKCFQMSMLIFEVRVFAESSYKRMRNPAKIYLADTSLGRRVTSADSGRLLENLVYLELRRRGLEVFYYEAKRECDFIIKEESGTLRPIQVCLELNESCIDREVEGLTSAAKDLGSSEGLLITLRDEQELTRDGIAIHVAPVWKWCLRP